MPKDRRTLLKEWLDEVGGWDAWTTERDVHVRAGLDAEAAHWKAAKDVGYPGGVPRTTAPPAASEAVPDVSESFGGGGIRGDFDWVYRHVSVETVGPRDAPSSGAWGLLKFARSDPRAFFTKWMDIASRQDDSEQMMEGFREDTTRRTDEIAEMLRSFRGARDDKQGRDLAAAVDDGDAGNSESTERRDDAVVTEVVAVIDPVVIGPGDVERGPG
jgi:hypothetical protein